MTCPTAYSCAYRVGRLARVQIEHTPGSFWSMFYDYVGDGQTGSERWPDGSETVYTYSVGRRIRMTFPARPGDAVRYDYDTTADDGHDPSEVRRIVGERSGDFVTWANNIARDSLGRITTVTTHDNPSYLSRVSWRTDGRVGCWWVYRRASASTSTPVADRCYWFSADGSALGHDSLASADSPRTFFYDGGNRLTCAASTVGASTCPTGTGLVESYVYDESDNRDELRSSAGLTTYLLWGNSLYDEYPPSRTIWYAYSAGPGGTRSNDREVTSGAPSNLRAFTYDGEGRLAVVTVPRPTSTPSSTRQPHFITTLYDHRARPLMVLDYNQSTSVEARWQYYYDLDDRLVNYVETPNASAPTTRNVYSYVHIEPLLIGAMRSPYVSGVLGTEQFAYYATAPEGLPAAAYTFDRVTLATSEVWRAQWGPFGTLLGETGSAATWRPPFRFQGQLELPRSDVSWWNGQTMFTSRQSVVHNRWRTYDPRVGQYLQPEPLLLEGAARPHPYAYAGLAPVDAVDPDGRDWRTLVDIWCLTQGIGNPYCIRRNLRRLQNRCGGGPSSAAPPAPRPPPPPPPSSGYCLYEECRGENCRPCCQFQAPAEDVEDCVRYCCVPGYPR